jgi:hypothetical protein
MNVLREFVDGLTDRQTQKKSDRGEIGTADVDDEDRADGGTDLLKYSRDMLPR